MPVHSCPQCGSRDVRPARWFIGPIEFLNEPADTVICGECGHRGLALRFGDVRRAERYARSLERRRASRT
jgi:hypothetical protein